MGGKRKERKYEGLNESPIVRLAVFSCHKKFHSLFKIKNTQNIACANRLRIDMLSTSYCAIKKDEHTEALSIM